MRVLSTSACQLLANHQCTTVQQRGWAGFKNGVLLNLAAREFDAMITCDQSIRHQQNLATLPIAVLELSTNDLTQLQAAATSIDSAVSNLAPKCLTQLAIP